MPRGVPKKDETGMRYTLFHIPPTYVVLDVVILLS